MLEGRIGVFLEMHWHNGMIFTKQGVLPFTKNVNFFVEWHDGVAAIFGH